MKKTFQLDFENSSNKILNTKSNKKLQNSNVRYHLCSFSKHIIVGTRLSNAFVNQSTWTQKPQILVHNLPRQTLPVSYNTKHKALEMLSIGAGSEFNGLLYASELLISGLYSIPLQILLLSTVTLLPRLSTPRLLLSLPIITVPYPSSTPTYLVMLPLPSNCSAP